MSVQASNFSDVFNDDLLSSSLFLELETANASPLTTGGDSPVPVYDFGVPLKYEEPIVIPSSPNYTRPSSPTSSVGSKEALPAPRWPSSLANSNLSEEEKERIRREKKREADRKCRKRKKERTLEMENKLRRLEEEKVVMLHKIDSLQRATASATAVGEEEGADLVATKAVDLFNINLVECATFIRAYHSSDCEVISPSTFSTGQDAVVKFWMDMKQRFPNSKLKATSTKSEGGGKFHISWKITGMLSNGAALSLDGNTFVSVKGGVVTKIVSMWDASSVLAQFGMTHDEFVKKSETASYFEDFLI